MMRAISSGRILRQTLAQRRDPRSGRIRPIHHFVRYLGATIFHLTPEEKPLFDVCLHVLGRSSAVGTDLSNLEDSYGRTCSEAKSLELRWWELRSAGKGYVATASY